MENLRPNEQRAKYAIIMVWVVMTVSVLSLISGLLQYNLLSNAEYGLGITEEEATANDLREQLLAILYLIVYVISAITFIQWFRRAYYNLHLRVKGLQFTEGWAAGSWFVPIISLYRPLQIMKDLYLETMEFLGKKGSPVSDDNYNSRLNVWWTLWIINNVLGQIIFRYSRNATDISDFKALTILDIVSNLVDIPLAIVTVKMIVKYSAMETTLAGLKAEEATELPQDKGLTEPDTER